MNIAQQRIFRLVERGGAGLACDEEGVALGGVELARVRREARRALRCEVRAPDEIGQILRAAYGPQSDTTVLRLHRGLGRAAAWIELGDVARAGIETVMLGLPCLSRAAMAKLATIADLEKAGNTAWETEPRVPSGHAGAGQWTTGDGAPQPAARSAGNVARHGHSTGNAHVARLPKPGTRRQIGYPLPKMQSDLTPARNLLVHINTAATIVDGRGKQGDFVRPKDFALLGRAAPLVYGAQLLDRWDAGRASDQIAKAIARFGLDPNRRADVVAASAYVWSRYALPTHTDAPFSGPKLDAASQAVMRYVLANPDAFAAMLQKPSPQSVKTFSLIIGAADAGLADYTAESRARPAGVAPELQTTSRSARAAIAHMLQTGKMQAHHLIPAETWGAKVHIADLALKDGWFPDIPSNLIALPANEKTRLYFGGLLPMHNQGHPTYSRYTEAQIDLTRSAFPHDLTPLQARAILESVAVQNRFRILRGDYNPIMKVAR